MSGKISQKLNQLYSSNNFLWLIIFVGTALRLIRYLDNSSLYSDESGIAVNLISRSFSDLFYPFPDIAQGYPFAFLTFIKLLTHFFGNSEYVLRLFPLLSGISSLFLFYKVAKYYIDPKALPIALGLFAVLESLVFESVNLKPYSSDVLFTLLMYSLVIYVQSKEFNIPRIILFGVCGALVIWFSNPSVFVLSGLGVCLVVFSLSKKEWSKIGKLSIAFSIWILSFVANYFFYLRNLQTKIGIEMEEVLTIFEKAYMPFPPKSLADIKWFVDLFFEIFNYPLSLTLIGMSALAFLIGCAFMYTQKKRSFFLLISPILVTFSAGAAHTYAFKGRFIIFLVPLMLIIIAEGAEHIRNRTSQNFKMIGIIFLSLLLFHPISTSAYRIIRPFHLEEMKPVLKYVKENWQKGDVLYVHYFAQYPFDFYSKYYPKPYMFDESEYIIGIAPRGWYRHHNRTELSKHYDPGTPIKQSSMDIFKLYAKDLDRLKGNKRVWVLFTRHIPKDGIIEEKYYLYHLETNGKRLDYYGHSGKTAVYLYDLSTNEVKDAK